MSEKRALRKISGTKTDEVTRDWRKLHNEEFRNLYHSPNTISMVEERRPLGRPRR
jgi:hypothetical protein